MKNLESRIEKLEKAIAPSNEPVCVVLLPRESASVEEWVSDVENWQAHCANPDHPYDEGEWYAVSCRGLEATHYGSCPPAAKSAD